MTYCSSGWGGKYSKPCSTYQGKKLWPHSSICSITFFTSEPLLNYIVVWTLVHYVHRLDVSGQRGIEGCVNTLIFLSSLCSHIIFNHHNSLQVNLCLWTCLGIHSILVDLLGSNNFCKPITPHHQNQIKPLLYWIRKNKVLGELVVPTDFWLIII